MLKLLLILFMLISSSVTFSFEDSWEEPREFNLKIQKIPEDASVYLDGKELDEDEVKLPVNQSHVLKVIHPDFLSKQVEVISPDGKNMKLDIELEPRSSMIEFELRPPNTIVEVNGVLQEVIDNKIHLAPGRYLFRFAAPQYYSQIEELVVGINKDYHREINLIFNDPLLPSSSKKITFRLDYNPYIYQNKEGWFSPIPLQMHAEYKYVSMGMGFYWLNEKDEKHQGQTHQLKREDHYDLWGELRLISPYFKKFKVNASFLYGNRISKYKSYSQSSAKEIIQSYSGMGIGMRYYFFPKFSTHIQMQQLGMRDRDTKKVRFEARSIVGFSFEF